MEKNIYIGKLFTVDEIHQFKKENNIMSISFSALEYKVGGYHFTKLTDGRYELSSTPETRINNQPKVNIHRKDSALEK